MITEIVTFAIPEGAARHHKTWRGAVFGARRVIVFPGLA